MSLRNVAGAKRGRKILVGGRLSTYRSPGEKAVCQMPGCNTILSIYNDSDVCAACGKKAVIVVKRRKRKAVPPGDMEQ